MKLAVSRLTAHMRKPHWLQSMVYSTVVSLRQEHDLIYPNLVDKYHVVYLHLQVIVLARVQHVLWL